MKKIIKHKEVIFILIGVLIVAILKICVIDKKVVSGNSMSSTFKDGDVLLVEKIDKSISRFDVVIIKTEQQGLKGSVIKRVIGLPNETVQIIDGYVYINDSKLDDYIFADKMEYAGIAESKITLGNDEYFVLGDNRNESEDSRNEWLGVIESNQITGKPIFRIYPFNRIEKIQKEWSN